MAEIIDCYIQRAAEELVAAGRAQDARERRLHRMRGMMLSDRARELLKWEPSEAEPFPKCEL